MTLEEKDLLNPNHKNVLLAIVLYFHAVEYSSTLTGYGNEMALCTFDTEAINIENLFDESVLKLSFAEWLYYLEKEKKYYLENHPEDEEQINEWLEDYKKITNLD